MFYLILIKFNVGLFNILMGSFSIYLIINLQRYILSYYIFLKEIQLPRNVDVLYNVHL